MDLVRKAKLTSKGQVTVPLEVRRALKLRSGDTLRFEVDEDGSARLVPDIPENPLSKWIGAWREGEGDSVETVLKRERALRE